MTSSTTPEKVSKISLPAFKAASGALCGFVLVAAALRIALRLRQQRRLYLSDSFLLFASISLGAGTGLLYSFCDNIYLDQAVALDAASVAIPPDFLDEAILGLKLLFAYQTVMWTVVFSVKASFLCFFRPLLRRLVRLNTWWSWVFVTTAVAYAFCAVDVYIICPHFDLSALKCAVVQEDKRIRPIDITALCFDIVTDLMIISIPFALLWNARIKPRQKFGLLLSLCLSIGMIIVTFIRATALPNASRLQDVPYQLFLLQVEGCVAVFMASVSAFRSLFASEGSNAGRQKPIFSPGFSAHHVFRKRGNRSLLGFESNDRSIGLPSIPSATMTGLRSFINGDPKSEALRSDFDDGLDDWPLTMKKPETLHTRNFVVGENV